MVSPTLALGPVLTTGPTRSLHAGSVSLDSMVGPGLAQAPGHHVSSAEDPALGARTYAYRLALTPHDQAPRLAQSESRYAHAGRTEVRHVGNFGCPVARGHTSNAQLGALPCLPGRWNRSRFAAGVTGMRQKDRLPARTESWNPFRAGHMNDPSLSNRSCDALAARHSRQEQCPAWSSIAAAVHILLGPSPAPIDEDL
jgi:hypothetical protein